MTKMRCQVTSNKTHGILISKEISYRSYKEICSGEKTKVNLGYARTSMVEKNSLVHAPRALDHYIHGKYPAMAYNWEVLSKFISIHNIEPNWLNCDSTWGSYDDELGGWTGCMGKVCGTEW